MPETAIRAVLWDFGGVILSSPFDAFARYEEENGLPADFLRGINATNPDTNAWALLERGDIDLDGFYARFAEEGQALGHDVDAKAVLALINGDVRPRMVAALRAVGERYKTACLTNNIRRAGPSAERSSEIAEIMALFDIVVESSLVGFRKPDPRFYTHACQALEVAPEETVFLDDLGINLKPARAMGIRTIKVTDPERALDELESHLGHSVRE
jgi:putative hydrolase of the HAD superfamily